MVRGEELHLDHTDDGRSYLGFSHASCNESAGARLGNRRRKGASFVSDVTVGIEASQDRRHVSIVECGEQTRRGRTILVACLSHYLDGGSKVVETVKAIGPVTVAVDAMGPGRHLIDQLEDEEIHLAFPTLPELSDAQATFTAKISRRELFIAGRDELDAAVQHAHLRTGEGVPRLSRSGPADQSPLNAAVLALWAQGKQPIVPFIWQG